MDASFSSAIDGRAVAGRATAVARDIAASRPEPEDQLSRGGRLATSGLASRLRDLAAVALLAFAAISPVRAEPYPGPADTVQRADR